MSFNENDIDWEEFRNPPKSARPMVRWWWTGMDVEEEELIREIKELDDVGFLGAEIQVFMIGSPLNLGKLDIEREKRSHRFMTPYYYQMVKAVLDEASKRNMIIDLTIGSSWPAGGVHIDKDLSMKMLLIGQKVIEGPIKYSDTVPEPVFPRKKGFIGDIDYSRDKTLIAVVGSKPIGEPKPIKFKNFKTSYLESNTLIDLTHKVHKNDILNWEAPEGNWQIFSFYICPSGVVPLADSRSDFNKKSLVLDHLSSKPIKHHLDLHLGEGKHHLKEHYGKTLRAFFTDSLELASNWLWTREFLSKFKEWRGYDLTPYLPICFVPDRDNVYEFGGRTLLPAYDIKGNIGDKIRYDYELTISDLFSKELVQTMTDWAEKNDLKNRIQAYGLRADTLKIYGISHIPETEQLYGGGLIDFLKLAGSAGIIYDKPIITAESIVWNQRDYMTTPLKWKVAADRLFSSGVNQMIYHGYPYQNPLFPYPGFCGFSTPYLPQSVNFSSNFSRNNPFWEFFPIMNSYITRCQYILQHGKIVSNIAVFYSVFNYCHDPLKKEELTGGCLDQYDAPLPRKSIQAIVKNNEDLNNTQQWTLSLLYLTDDLSSYGFFYSHVNEETILNSTIKENKLIIGNGTFEVLIIPNITKISLEMALKLKKIAESNIPVIFIDSIPEEQPGYLNYEKNNKEIKDIFETLLQNQKIYLLKEINEVSRSIIEDLKIKPGIEYEEPQSSINYIHKKTENSDYYFFRHSKNIPKEINVIFPHPNKVPFILDPWTGKIEQAIRYRKQKDAVEMKLHFEPYGSYIIEFKISKAQKPVFDAPKRSERLKDDIIGYIKEKSLSSILLEDWHLYTNLRDHEGKLTPIDLDLKGLKDWREITELKYCSSKGTYTTTFNLTKDYIQDYSILYLSLGRVHDVAIVKINGKECPPLLVYPYEVNITSLVKEGENQIEVEITPTLRNRLIGYGKNGGEDWVNHKNKKEFMPSGLIGPVKLNPFKKVVI